VLQILEAKVSFMACQNQSLTELEELDFSDNNIKYFPPDIINFQNLRILVVSINPWENLDDVKKVTDTVRSRGAIVHD